MHNRIILSRKWICLSYCFLLARLCSLFRRSWLNSANGMVIAFTIRIILVFLFLFLFYLFFYLSRFFFYFSFIAIIEIDEITAYFEMSKNNRLIHFCFVFDWIFSIFFCYIEIKNCHVINSDTYDAYIHCIFFIYMFWLRLYMLIILIWIYYTSVYIAYIYTYASICFIVYFEVYYVYLL